MGKPSGSAMKVNFLPVNSSILVGSISMLREFILKTTSSKLSTSKAKCLNPVASGLLGLLGGLGNENNSTI